jgi:hypothetical protein
MTTTIWSGLGTELGAPVRVPVAGLPVLGGVGGLVVAVVVVGAVVVALAVAATADGGVLGWAAFSFWQPASSSAAAAMKSNALIGKSFTRDGRW